MKHYTDIEKSIIRRLRQRYKPEEIAPMVGRTKKAVKRILSIEKKNGAQFPKLKHGNLKHDSIEAQQLREMIRMGKNYRDIQREKGIHPSVISRTLAAEARGELAW